MNIVRIYNQNRKKIWKAILIIALFIIILQLINYYVIRRNESEYLGNESSNSNIMNGNTSYNSSVITSNTSGVSGSEITNEEIEETQNLLDEFIGYCNNGDLSNAYNMLTDECKELIYPTSEIFEANYYNNIFNGEQKIYNFENWNQNTYIVTIEEDSLFAGRVSSDTEKKVDYITIVEDKLNISSFIGRTEVNEEKTSNGITVIINSIDTYMDYETYNITVTNNTGNTICLADVNNTYSMYLLDSNEIRYGVYNHELVQNNLVLKNGFYGNYSLKFYSSYISTKQIEYLVFDNVYMDYENDEDSTRTIYIEI